MDYSKRNKTRVYHNKFYNQHTEDDNYPERIKKPIAIIIVMLMIASFIITFELFK